MLKDSQTSAEFEITREYVENHPYVDDKGIWAPCHAYTPKGTASTYKMIITKDLFVEAYNKWIRGNTNE